MGYHPVFTPSIVSFLKAHPGQKFTASDLKEATRIPKKFVRRAVTDDEEIIAEHPIRDVKMEWKMDRWYYWWDGGDGDPPVTD